MLKNKRKFGLLAIAFFLILSIVGCGSNKNENTSSKPANDTPSNTTSTNTNTNKPAEKVKLTVWAPVPTSLQWPAVYEEFQKENPDIEIDYWRGESSDYEKKLQTAVAGGEGPDVLWLNGSLVTKYANMLESLEDYANKDWGADWKNELTSPSFIDDVSVDGKIVSLPFLIAGQPLVLYNKSIFDENSLQPPTNFEEWKKVTETLKAKGLMSTAIGLKDTWIGTDMFMTFANQFAPGKVYDAIEGKTSFEDPAFVEALKAFKQVFDSGVFEDGSLGVAQYPNARDQYFYDRKAAMFATGSWHLGYALPTGEKNQGTKIQQDQTGAFLFPQVGPNPTQIFASVDGGFGINSESKQKEAAWKFVSFITKGKGEQVMVDFIQGFSPWKGISAQSLDQLQPSDQEAIKMAAKAFETPIGPRGIKYPEVDKAMGVAVQDVAAGKAPEKALKELQAISATAKR